MYGFCIGHPCKGTCISAVWLKPFMFSLGCPAMPLRTIPDIRTDVLSQSGSLATASRTAIRANPAWLPVGRRPTRQGARTHARIMHCRVPAQNLQAAGISCMCSCLPQQCTLLQAGSVLEPWVWGAWGFIPLVAHPPSHGVILGWAKEAFVSQTHVT